jgi:O-methyltransferase
VYYLRRCLHDYSNAECVGILQHIADAMAEDSRLLVVELVLANPPNELGAAVDIYMMMISGVERTAEGFKAIIEAAGLKMLKVWEADGSDYGVIECVKA